MTGNSKDSTLGKPHGLAQRLTLAHSLGVTQASSLVAIYCNNGLTRSDVELSVPRGKFSCTVRLPQSRLDLPV